MPKEVIVPSEIFHVTEPDRLDSIKKQGILPRVERGTNTEPRVYVCLDQRSATKLIEEREKVTDRSYVILKISTSNLNACFFKDFDTHPDIKGAWTVSNISPKHFIHHFV